MRLATSTRLLGPVDEHARSRRSASVASMSARRGDGRDHAGRSAASTASATASSQVTSQARPSGPCSACTMTSTAARSAATDVVGDHHDLGRPGERRRHADPTLAGDLALGHGDVDVARARR